MVVFICELGDCKNYWNAEGRSTGDESTRCCKQSVSSLKKTYLCKMKTPVNILIFSAPSGSGKTTIVHHLLQKYPQLEFSISATSRAPRGKEQHGKDYYFLSADEFRQKIANNEFVEWEEVYPGCFYGTLHSEIARIHGNKHIAVFDIDVKGGVNLKRLYGEQAQSVFIQPPSLEALRERLISRNTDTPEVIERRLAKAEDEMRYAPQFDIVLVNEVLADTLKEAGMLMDGIVLFKK